MKKKISLVASSVLIAGIALAGCGRDEALGPGEMGCVFDEKTGELAGNNPRLPGSKARVGQDEIMYRIPISDRFWNMSDTGAKDASASKFMIGRDSENRETRGEGEIKFIIHPANGCEFFVEHLYRYRPLDFEVEGNPNTGWMKVLGRNVDTAITDAFDIQMSSENGLLAALELPTNASTDGTLPDGAEPEETLRQKFSGSNTEFGKEIVTQITDKLGGKYICGPTTNVSDPNDCDPVSVDMFRITLDPQYNEIVAGWEKVKLDISQAELNRREEAVRAQNFENEREAKAAQNERDAATRELNNANELNKIESQREIEEARVQEAAAKELAVCEEAKSIFGSPLTAQECIEILAVTSGQYTKGAGNVTINSGE